MGGAYCLSGCGDYPLCDDWCSRAYFLEHSIGIAILSISAAPCTPGKEAAACVILLTKES